MDVEEQIVVDAKRLLMQELQLLVGEPHAIAYDLISISKNIIKSTVSCKVQNYCT